MELLSAAAQSTTGAWVDVPLQISDHINEWQASLEGTVGVGAVVTIEVRRVSGGTTYPFPDYAPSVIPGTEIVKFRAEQVRGIVTGGDGTTSLTLNLD